MQAFDIAPRKRTKSVLGLPRPPRRCTPHSVFAQPALSGFYLLIDRSRWATINSAVRRPRPSRSVRSVLQLKTWPALKKELLATPQRHAAAARVGKQRRGLGPLSAVMAERRTEPLLAVAAVKSLERQIGARRGAVNGRRLVQEQADLAEMLRALDVPRGRKKRYRYVRVFSDGSFLMRAKEVPQRNGVSSSPMWQPCCFRVCRPQVARTWPAT